LRNFENLNAWLLQSRSKEPLWTGAVRKFEWQAGDTRGTLDTMLWSLRGSGVRVKNPDYTPTLVAMSMVPVYGPLNVRLSPKELLRLQSFDEDFKYERKSIFKQIGNAVNVTMIEWISSQLKM
jgi:DNA (cytosine-5)-methyltransferase 1